MKILVIIPAYNEAGNLPGLFEELKASEENFDVLVINDCSNDDTEKVCRKNNVKVISLPANLGIGGAVQTGYKYALRHGYDIAVQVDGDGQHDPRYIKLLVQKIKEGCDLCIGSRFIGNGGFRSSKARRMGIRYFSWLIEFLTGKHVTDPTSGFRACSRKAIRLFADDYPKDYPEPETIMTVLRNNLRICEVPVTMRPRANGNSSISCIKAIYYMIKVTLAIIITAISRKVVHGNE